MAQVTHLQGTCARCRRPQRLLHRLIVQMDAHVGNDSMEPMSMAADLCQRCVKALASWMNPPQATVEARKQEAGE